MLKILDDRRNEVFQQLQFLCIVLPFVNIRIRTTSDNPGDEKQASSPYCSKRRVFCYDRIKGLAYLNTANEA